MAFKKKTIEERQRELKKLTSMIDSEVDKYVVDPKLALDFIAFRKQFYEYSIRNQMLIRSQNPRAIAVASFSHWKQKGASIKKGEKGIAVLRPVIVKQYRDNSGKWENLRDASDAIKTQVKTGAIASRDHIVGYQQSYVFDVTQTTFPKERYPEFIRRNYQSGTVKDYSPLIEAAKAYAWEKGVVVTDKELAPGHGGSYYPADHRIVMNAHSENDRYFSILTHELAHSQLHRYSKLETAAKEVQAEGVAALTMAYYGAEEMDVSYAYLSSYSKKLSSEKRLELIQGTLDMVQDYTEFVDQQVDGKFLSTIKEQAKEKSNHLSITKEPEIELRG